MRRRARRPCDAGLPTPTALRSADDVEDYKPVLKLCRREGREQVAIRTMRLSGEEALLLADPTTLATRIEHAACWTCEDAQETALADTRMMRGDPEFGRAAEAVASQLPRKRRAHARRARRRLCHRRSLPQPKADGPRFSIVARRPGDAGGAVDLRPLAQASFRRTIAGCWTSRAAGRLAITWTNHSYSHPYRKGVAEGENFLLTPGYDPDFEILETERLLIANGQTPSLFFRFPGLVSSSPLMQAVRRHHLISLGADAWLALNQTPHDGSIILVHPNGNEERGLKIYQRDAAKGVLPHPLKPLDEAP